MARARPSGKKVAAPTSFPFLYFGHGSSRVSDELALWIWFAERPTDDERAAIEAGMPADLLEVARKDGRVAWNGPVLHVDSGMDFKYVVQTYDPKHLEWLHAKLVGGAVIDQADLDRVIRDVSDTDLAGPRNPKRSTWDAFDSGLELWIRTVANRHALRLVVKDVTIKPEEETAWHGWSVASWDAFATALPAALAALDGRGASVADFIHPMLRFVFRSRPPKTLSPTLRAVCIELLALEGWSIEGDLLAKLVTSDAPRTHAAQMTRLFEAHHPGVLSLMLEAPTAKLLLDDGVYAAALAHASQCRLPGYPWHHGKGSINKRVVEPTGGIRPGLDLDVVAWARRMFAVTAANGSLDADAKRETDGGGTDQSARSTLRSWTGLRAMFEAAYPS